MAKIGDIVRFLNTTGGGKIVKIVDNLAYVEDEDGFETPVLIRECVVVGEAPAKPSPSTRPSAAAHAAAHPSKAADAPAPAPQPARVDDLPPVEETPGGEQLNLVIAWEPREIKQLSTTLWDAFLVNDSNFYLSFSFMSRGDDEEGWTLRNSGVIEPGIQLWLGEVSREDIPALSRIAFQYIAYKTDRPFALKNPALIERRLDCTKFFKLHCYRPSVYFDNEVIAIQLVIDDRPQRPAPVDASALEEAMKQKRAADSRPAATPRRQPIRRQLKRREFKASESGEPLVVDLHIAELLDDIRGLSPADMLNIQVDEFRRVMDENAKAKGQRIIFIHGKGEGVLRNALLKELSHRYKGHDVQDASFREYGFGATQVTI